MGTDNYPLSFHMAINHLSYPLKGFFCAAIWFRSKPSQYGKASKRQAFFVAFKASESACQILPHKRRQVRALFLAKEKKHLAEGAEVKVAPCSVARQGL